MKGSTHGLPRRRLRVTSEIGRLRTVLVHEPGPEIDQMVPAMMEDLLFDDILFGERAREEHARLRRVLQLLGVEVIDAIDLLEAALSGEGARGWLEGELAGEIDEDVLPSLLASDSGALAHQLVAGVRRAPVSGASRVDDLFATPPLPNWCFQRDPQVVLLDGVVLGAMATAARWREAVLARLIFKFHPDLAGNRIWLDLPPAHHEAGSHAHLEGGDVLILSSEVVVVGRSVRTNEHAIDRLARALGERVAGDGERPRWLLVVELPQKRAFMHLDTVLTPLDRDACLVHAPVLMGGGWESARVHAIDLHARDRHPLACDDLLGALAERGIDLEAIPCGGDDPLTQQREQWTDGANCLCLAPGVVMLYERNAATAHRLEQHGFDLIEAEDLLLGRAELDLDRARRTCLLVKGHEIARARGGPHCLSHPLVRDDVIW